MGKFCVKCGAPLNGGPFCMKCGTDKRGIAPPTPQSPGSVAQMPSIQPAPAPNPQPAKQAPLSKHRDSLVSNRDDRKTDL